MLGLMQRWPLTVDKIIDHAARWHGARQIVTRTSDGEIIRTDYARLATRARRLSSALHDLGVRPGTRVATLAWNTAQHLEAWYAIMGIGAVCHTLNPRLPASQLAWIAKHAEDQIILVDGDLLVQLESFLDELPDVRHVIVMGSDTRSQSTGGRHAHLGELLFSERLIEASEPIDKWGAFPEDQACGLCYTSGTTGNPKGVLYSHRSNFLHALVTLQPDVFALSARDVVLAVVPMFHANSWGLAFSAPAVGAKLVLPGPKLDGASLHELIVREGVTFAAGVPTVWYGLLNHLDKTKASLEPLRRIVVGGSACPESMLRRFQDDFGVEVIHAWGMTETSPLGVAFSPLPNFETLDRDQQFKLRRKQGRPCIGIDLVLIDDQGAAAPHDGQSVGALRVKGAYVAAAYYRNESVVLDQNGFFDTGDIATIDADGYLQITDRAKDLIKSGGEWISSIEIEMVAAAYPKTALAAAIAVPHPRWGERPLLVVKLMPGQAAQREEYLEFLRPKLAKWWLPDDVVFVEDMPLGATGKVDKKKLREMFANHAFKDA